MRTTLVIFFLFLSFSFLNQSYGFNDDRFNDHASFVFEGWKSEIDESQTDMLLHLEDEFAGYKAKNDFIFGSILGITDCHTELLGILSRDVRRLRRLTDRLHEDMRLLLDTR